MKYISHFFAFPACLLITAFLLLTSNTNAEIRIEWSEEYGYPDVVDWNQAYRDLYCGYPYDMTVEVINDDTTNLVIERIFSEHDYFSANPEELSLEPHARGDVTITFEPEEPGEYEAIMLFVCSEPEDLEIEIPLVAVASLPPVIVVSPQVIEEELYSGEISEYPIRVSNAGGSVLRFWIEIVIIDQPDDMDYEWRDNDERRGPEFEWFDLEEVDDVRVFELGDNENSGRIDLGWTFPFWDREFDHVYCHSDGWLSFTNDGDHTMADEWGDFPYDGETRNCIQVCNRDNREGTDLFFWTDEDRGKAVIEWYGDGTYRHQLILHSDGMAVMQYGEGMDGQDFWHVGLNYGDGERGWAISNNEEGYLTEGRAIAFGGWRAWHDWITVDPDEGEFEGGIELIITLDATDLVGGEYIAGLRIFSNVPNVDDYVAVDISMTVIPVPMINITPDPQADFPVDFGEVYVGFPEIYTIQIENVGTDDLEICEAIFEDESAFWIDDEDLPNVLAPDEIAEVPIGFDPPLPDNPQDDPVFYEEIISFVTNDPRYPWDPEDDLFGYPLWVEGWGLDAPELRLSTNLVEFDIDAGEIIEVPVGISNEGGSELVFETDIEIINVPERDNHVRTLRYVNFPDHQKRDRGSEPDDWDYEWRDNDERRGPEFEWFDLEEVDDVGVFELGDNENTGRIDLGWWFILWDSEFDRIYCHSDGWLSFTNDGDHTMADAWGEFPHDGETRNCIQVCNRDNREGTDLFFWTDEDGMAVIEWHADGTYRHQLILHEDGLAVMQYGEGMEGQDFWHVGVNYGDGEYGWTISNNEEGYLTEDRAIGIGDGRAWHEWIELDPAEGRLDPAADMNVFVILSAVDLMAGEYVADVHFLSNDPEDDPEVGQVVSVFMYVVHPVRGLDPTETIPLPAELGGDPIQFEPAYVDVDDELGGLSTFDIILVNSSSEEITFDDIVVEPEGEFDFEFEGEVIPPFDDVTITLFFRPADYDERYGTITFHSNAPNEEFEEGLFHYELRGVGQERPGRYTPDNFPQFVETDYCHTWTVNELTIGGNPAPNHWEIGAFAPEPEDNLSGATVWIDRFNVELPLYGDDPETEDVVEGFVGGDEILIRVWDPEARQECNARVEILEGNGVWVNNGETTVNISVGPPPPPNIFFQGGWNMISLRIYPDERYEHINEGPVVRDMCEQALMDGEDWLLIIMKDAAGDFCVPARDYWGIDYWNDTEGYLMKVVGDPDEPDDDFGVSWWGIPIHPQTEFDVADGWSIIPYYPDYILNASFGSGFYVIPENIVEHLIIAKDGQGHFMAPEHGFSNMDLWTPGQGYMVKLDLDEPVAWVYPVEQDEQAAVAGKAVRVLGTHWTVPNGAENMSVLVTSVAGLAVEDGDQIGAFNNDGRLVGVGTVSEGMCGLAVWGDDPTTPEVDGALDGQALMLKLMADEEIVDVSWDVIAGKLIYHTDAFAVVELAVYSVIPDEFAITSAYPNPFNSTLRVDYALPEVSDVALNIYDLSGRLVAELVDGRIQAGIHTVVFDGSGLVSGVYVVCYKAAGHTSQMKVVLVK